MGNNGKTENLGVGFIGDIYETLLTSTIKAGIKGCAVPAADSARRCIEYLSIHYICGLPDVEHRPYFGTILSDFRRPARTAR